MNTQSSHKPLLRNLLTAASLLAALGIGLPAMASGDDATTPQAHSDSMGAALTDADITVKVKLAIADVASLKKSEISVTTTNGVVTLTGMANSSASKSEAESAAMSVQGVKSVDDQLSTPPSSSAVVNKTAAAAHATERVVSDSWITTKVKSELMADSVSKGFAVDVTTVHGVVVLKGTLANQDAIAHV
ncbi:MAG: BON domain-containing protein, partial [Gammaproteobacteria bacterium]